MNIFYLDSDPKVAAQYHVDKHVVKMILESAQLLCTAHRLLDGHQIKQPKVNKSGKVRDVTRYVLDNTALDSTMYGTTHVNHPCTIWCRDNINNYMWLYELFVNLCEEYTYRYGKQHKTDFLLRNLLSVAPVSISTSSFTQPAQAMPEKYRCTDSIRAYRQYYINEKHTFAKWSKRSVPEWFI
jgi:hypothetical protein